MPERPTLLCSASFPPNTGFAWSYIEGVYAQVANRLAKRGIRTLVAYPRLSEAPRELAGSAALPVELDLIGPRGPSWWLDLAQRLRRENVRVLYLTDRPALHASYALFRAYGVRRIVVHDHSSGDRIRPAGLKRLAKWVAVRIPALVADEVLAVSDYVARRNLEVGLLPRSRVRRIYNGVRLRAVDGSGVRQELGIDPGAPIVACACRATPVKGVATLLKAFAGLSSPAAVLIYVGDGPELSALRELRTRLPCAARIQLLGYRADPLRYLAAADVCVVPSLWQEAFGLSVVEPMMLGKPVIATRVGGIPELIEDGRSGLLIAPGDETALTRAMERLLQDPALRHHIGREGRQKVCLDLTLERKLTQLVPLLEGGFGSELEGDRGHRPPPGAALGLARARARIP